MVNKVFWILTVSISVLIFGSGLYLGVANAQNDNSVLLDKAASLIELGDPKSAIPLLKEVLEGDPDNIKALKNLSLAYFKLNMHAESIILFDKIIQLEGHGSEELLYMKGVSLTVLGQGNEAVLFFDQVLRKNPTNVSTLIAKGVALKNLQKHDDALSSFDNALKLEPYNMSAKLQRLDVLKHLKDHDEIRSSLVDILGLSLEKIEFFENKNCNRCYGDVPWLFPMRDTDEYIGSVQIKIRDSFDNLVAVVESDMIDYPVHPLFDKMLSKYPVSRILEKDGISYEMRNFSINKADVEINDYFMDRLAISSKLIPVLFSYNMGIAVEEGDSFVAEWEIGKRI